MNQAPPGQVLAGQANNAQKIQAKDQPQVPHFFKPEEMRNMFFLTEEERTKYEKGLSQLWKLHDSAAPGSLEQIETKKKLIEFGKILTAKIHQRQQQQGQGQGQAAQPAVAGNASNVPRPAAGPAPAGQARPLPAHIINHVNTVQFQVPADLNVPDKAKWLEDLKSRYAKALFSIEQNRNLAKMIEKALENQALTPEQRKQHEDRKAQAVKNYNEAARFANNVRQQYIVGGGGQRVSQDAAAGENAATQASPQLAQGAAQPPNQAASHAGAPMASPANPMQSSAAAVNAAFEAARQQQLAAGRMSGAVNALSAQNGPPSLPQAQPAQTQAPATPAQAQPSPVTQAPAQPIAAQPQPQQPQKPIQQPVAPLKLEPAMQAVPSPINTAVASAAAAGVPSAGTPTQNSARIQTPQSATPTIANSNVRPLSHADAVTKASQSVPGVTAATAQVGGTPGLAPGVGVPGGQQMPQAHYQQQQQQQHQQQQQQGHPHVHPQQGGHPTATALHSKLPIPKTLHEKAIQMPTPVPNIGGIGATGRPTFTGGSGTAGGVLNQPVLAKTPAYQLEGEGERVLNKKKLDELVRQVCGGTAEGQEGNLLTPEVEEAVLNMADTFIDTVIAQACRNAKERGSKVLEIRDMQLVLERTFNIRIPGYSSEELRTVRKVQPNSSWIKKMSAVQAAKVVPGKGDI
ncbi:hypothetical protein VTJ83DRAFT_3171 [Remersonia thermophila]|uniref:Transcription initiation factor TFIID subunit 12 domain-containing protein n=1 Tax=Remersonia thermophila TaxID=72144 RepID=A0ABR4DDA0_9PEZI